ncbi:SpoIIE family protein phosphatase [Streptomyces sp. NPDC088745]|uniref:SpoIIE family protein phosphatase n=1 Tax=Streptomyces sp. NPDC088745 TaxID=3365884 RepID=UPI00380DFF2A
MTHPSEAAPALVLVVDDNPTNRYVVSTTLLRAGHRVLEAADGTQALAVLSESDPLPEVAIVDVRLPDMTGFEVCERIKADPRTTTIPVIHISASAITVSDRTQGLNRGADAYLTEPIAPVVMLATVTATLRYARARSRAEALARRLHRLNQATLALYSAPDARTLAQAAADSAAELLGTPAAVSLTLPQGAPYTAASPAADAPPAADASPVADTSATTSAAPASDASPVTNAPPPPDAPPAASAPPEGAIPPPGPGRIASHGVTEQSAYRSLAPPATSLLGARLRTLAPGQWPAAPGALAEHPLLTLVSARAKPARPPVHLIVPATAITGLDDEELLAQLAHACTLALEALNAYSEEHALALTLQRGFLPEFLPDTTRADLAVRYLPASRQTEIGGDFYEALVCPTGLVVAVGDVAGHSLDAAMVMGQVRHALRAYATEGHPPDVVLRLLDRLLRTTQPGVTVTLCVLLLEDDSDTVQVANAGHLPPLLRTPDGEARFLEEHGPLLGVGLPHPPALRVAVPAGSELLLVTDGLIERRRQDIRESLAALAAAHAQGPRTPEALCAYLLERFPPDGNDDIALMSVHVNAHTA